MRMMLGDVVSDDERHSHDGGDHDHDDDSDGDYGGDHDGIVFLFFFVYQPRTVSPHDRKPAQAY